ncbi:putative tyrosine phosphatase [Syncephalis plumigaleata]|nr:putative tyrosine phosphatase [Syncephalis plumigaleata]
MTTTVAEVNYETDPSSAPLNFALVEAGIYRSGHPNPKNYRFLEKLGLRSSCKRIDIALLMFFLAKEDYPPDMLAWLKKHDIAFYQYRTAGNKEPFTEMDPVKVASLLSLMLDVRNHPVLVHCNKGKHRVGCLIGCLRKLQNWSLTSILAEYKRLAAKQNIADEEFIELFATNVDYSTEWQPKWLKSLSE